MLLGLVCPAPVVWFVGISCTVFKNTSFPAIPTEGRADTAVRDLFGDKKHSVWLADQDANTQHIDYQFRTALTRCKPQDVCVVFYSGHGYLKKGRLHLATWNAEIGDQGWSMRRAFAQVKERFKGRALILFADCCAAGPLADLAQSSPRPVFVLGSSRGVDDVPMDWSFSKALSDLLVSSEGAGWPTLVESIWEKIGRQGTAYSPAGVELNFPLVKG